MHAASTSEGYGAPSPLAETAGRASAAHLYDSVREVTVPRKPVQYGRGHVLSRLTISF